MLKRITLTVAAIALVGTFSFGGQAMAQSALEQAAVAHCSAKLKLGMSQNGYGRCMSNQMGKSSSASKRAVGLVQPVKNSKKRGG